LPRWFLIKVFNEAISIKEDLILPDFSLPEFLMGNIVRVLYLRYRGPSVMAQKSAYNPVPSSSKWLGNLVPRTEYDSTTPG
jgi:hypothetical protein